MPEGADAGAARWADACLAAALCAADPAALGGVRLRAPAGPVRDAWLAHLRAALPSHTPLRRLPLHAGDERLLGGLDLAATLDAGRPVLQRGLLAECHGGVLLLAMAERVAPATAARLAQALDTGRVRVAREGALDEQPARFGLVALDEGQGDDEALPAALADRLAFWVDLSGVSLRDIDATEPAPLASTADAAVDADIVEALCATAQALGIASLRAPLAAARTAGRVAATRGRTRATADDAALAARIVLAPRAIAWPSELEPSPDQPPAEPAPPDEQRSNDTDDATHESPERKLEDAVLDAVAAALPAGLLQRLATGAHTPSQRNGQGAGVQHRSPLHGTPAGVQRGDPRGGARLSVIETLRAAAPWQRLRNATATATATARPARVQVRADDFRVQRHQARSARTIVFAVDASGSAALHRLGEAKGAVELLLADCYVKRDRVAVIAFRGRGAELVLPPTRSLVRARRDLAGLPGGGGTPLAAALDAALALAFALRRGGDMPLLVLLTDGRANVARDGSGGRARAEAQALDAAGRLHRARVESLLLDIAPRPQAAALALAARMGARYVPLPHAGAQALSAAVRSQGGAPAAARLSGAAPATPRPPAAALPAAA